MTRFNDIVGGDDTAKTLRGRGLTAREVVEVVAFRTYLVVAGREDGKRELPDVWRRYAYDGLPAANALAEWRLHVIDEAQHVGWISCFATEWGNEDETVTSKKVYRSPAGVEVACEGCGLVVGEFVLYAIDQGPEVSPFCLRCSAAPDETVRPLDDPQRKEPDGQRQQDLL